MFGIFLKSAGSGKNPSFKKTTKYRVFFLASHVTCFIVVVAIKHVTHILYIFPQKKWHQL